LSAIAVAHARAGELHEAVATARQIQPASSRAEALLEVVEVWLERPGGSKPAQDRSSAD
jgi:hypothetical protein